MTECVEGDLSESLVFEFESYVSAF